MCHFFPAPRKNADDSSAKVDSAGNTEAGRPQLRIK